MREIVFDTETTGLDPASGHRVVEIGCVEIFNSIPTGETFHVYLNPERAMPDDAFRVHGLASDFLADKPVFKTIAAALAAFLGDAVLVAHNAEFDIRFLNAEFARCGHSAIGMHRVQDTLAIARRRHPGAPASLDALCARYRIDATRRLKHGALLDAELLAEVYAELNGGRQSALLLDADGAVPVAAEASVGAPLETGFVSLIDAAEHAAHTAFVATLGAKALWGRYARPIDEPS